MSTDHRHPQKDGVISKELMSQISGKEFLQGILDGKYPEPPINKVLEYKGVEVADGRAVFTTTPKAKFYNHNGCIHGGYLATLLDTCMACAIQTKLEPGFGLVTVEFKINFVRPVMETTGQIFVESTLLSLGRTIGTAEGRIKDAAGKLYAIGLITCSIISLTAPPKGA